MPLSYATVTVTDIPLSPMQVIYTPPSGSALDLGATVDGVTISIKTDFGDIHADQYGKTVLNQKIAGQHFQVKLTLAEMIDKLRIWATAFPYMLLGTDGSGHYIGILNNQVGDDMLAIAGTLTLHPLSQSAADKSQDYNFDLAACLSAAEIKYAPDKQSGLATTFMIYPNTSVSPARFMRYGDTTIATTGATVGTPTAGSNTGNGTVTSQAVYNTYTKTETVTLTCVSVDSTHGTLFEVVGSVGGLYGVVPVGGTTGNLYNFVCNQVSFTMTQGATKWAYGDTWTIATVAANYT
jgi:hypothetical protein